MNWGKKILLLYLGFVGLILTLVFTCFGHKTELEYKDYYARELRFQDQINARQNAVALEEPIVHSVEGMQLRVTVPRQLLTGDLEGNIELMRPSDASKDINQQLATDKEGNHTLSVTEKGPYRLRVTLTSRGTDYFHEAVVRFK